MVIINTLGETCSLEQMVIHLSQEPDTMMMSPAPGGPTSLKEK